MADNDIDIYNDPNFKSDEQQDDVSYGDNTAEDDLYDSWGPITTGKSLKKRVKKREKNKKRLQLYFLYSFFSSFSIYL